MTIQRCHLFLPVLILALVASACEKTKFKSSTPNVTPSPTTPPNKSPDENGQNRIGGESPVVAVTPINPQPPLASTPLPPVVATAPVGQLPPKVTEVPGLGGKPVQTIPPKWDPPPPSVSLPPNKVLLQLRVVQLNYEAWWKNCLIVSVAGDTKEVGCNKTTRLNTTVNLLANKDECNKLDVRVQTYYPVPGSCKPGFECNGPYNSIVDLDRTAGDVSSSSFFKAYDRNNILTRDPLVAIADSTAEIKAQMDSFANNTQNNRWVRIYFEDQSKANLDLIAADPSRKVEAGIDFNDYVFDLRGEGVQFYVNGLEPMGCTRK